MPKQKSDGGLSSLIKQAARTTSASETTEGADDVLKQTTKTPTAAVPDTAAPATTPAENRRRRDREQTRAITIHIDHELHGDIRKLAAEIQRPAEIMLRRILRRVVTDGLLGKANKYVN